MTQYERHQLADEASRLLKEEQDEKALAILDKLAVTLPKDVDIQAARAFCLGRLDRIDEAYVVLDMARVHGNTPRLKQTVSFLNSRRGRPDLSTVSTKGHHTHKSVLPVLDIRNDSNQELTKKLRAIQNTFASEIAGHREREEEARKRALHVEKALRDKESTLQGALSRNVELELLLSQLGEEVSNLQQGLLESTGPQLRVIEAEPAQSTDTLVEDILDHKIEMDRLNVLIDERDVTLTDAFRKTAELKKEVASLQSELKSMSENRDAEQAAIDDIQVRESGWGGERLVFQATIDELTNRCHGVEEQLRTSEAREAELRAQNIQIEQSDSAGQAEQASMLSQAQESRAALEGDIISLRDQLDVLKQKSASGKVAIEEYETRENRWENDRSVLQASIDKLTNRCGEVEEKLLSSEAHEAELAAEVTQALENAFTIDAERIQKLDDVEQARAALESEVTTLCDDLRALKESHDNQQGASEDYQAREYAWDEERLVLQASIDELTSRCERVEDQIRIGEELETKLRAQVAQALDSGTAADADRIKKLNDAEDSRIALEKDVLSLRGQLDALKETRDSDQATSEEYQNRESAWDDERISLQASIDELTDRCGAVSDQLKATGRVELELRAQVAQTSEVDSAAENELAERHHEAEQSHAELVATHEELYRVVLGLQDQVDQAELSETASNEEKEATAAQLSELRSGLADVADALEAERSRSTDLQALISAHEQEKRTLNQKIDSRAQEHLALQTQVAEFQTTIEDYQAQRDTLHAVKTSLESQLQDLSQLRDQIQSELDEARVNLSTTEQRVVEKSEEHEGAVQAIEESTRQVDTLEASLAETQEQREQAEQRLTQYSDELAAVTQSRDALGQDLVAAKNERDRLTLELTQAHADFKLVDQSEVVRLEEVSHLQRQLREMESTEFARRTEVNSLRTETESLREEHANALAEHAALAARGTTLETELAAAEASIAELSQARTAVVESRDALENALNDAQSHLESIQQERDEQTNHINSSNEASAEVRAELERSTTDLVRAQADIETLQADLESRGRQAEQLTDELATAVEQVASLRTEMEQQGLEHATLLEQHDTTKSQLEQTEQQVDTLGTRVSDLQSASVADKTVRQELQARLAQETERARISEETLERLTNELAVAAEAHADMQATLNSSRDTIAKLESQLEALTAAQVETQVALVDTQSKVDLLIHQQEESRIQVEGLEAELDDAKATIRSATTKLDAREESLSLLRTKAVTLTAQIEEQATEIETGQTQLSALESDYAKVQHERDRIEDSAAALRRELDTSRDQLGQSLSQAQQDSADLAAQLESRTEEHRAAETRIHVLESDYSQLQRERETIENHATELRGSLETLRGEQAALSTDHVSLTEQHGSIEEKLSEQLQQIASLSSELEGLHRDRDTLGNELADAHERDIQRKTLEENLTILQENYATVTEERASLSENLKQVCETLIEKQVKLDSLGLIVMEQSIDMGKFDSERGYLVTVRADLREELEETRVSIAELEEQLIETERARETLEIDIQERDASVATLAEQRATLKSEFDDLQNQLNAQEQAHRNLEVSHKEMTSSRDTLESSLNALTKQSDSLEAKHDELVTTHENTSRDLSERESALASLQEKYEALNDAHATTVGVLERSDAEFEQLTEAQRALTLERTALGGDVRDRDAQIDGLTREATVLRSSIESLEGERSVLHTKASELSEERITLQETIEGVQQDLAEQRAQLAHETQHRESVQSELNNAKNESNELGEQKQKVQTRLVEHEAKIVGLNQTIVESRAELVATNKRVDDEGARAGQIEAALADARQESDHAYENVSQLELQIIDLEKVEQDLRQQVEELNVENQNVHTDLTQRVKHEQTLREKVDATRDSLKETGQELDWAQVVQRKMKGRIDELQSEWNTIRHEELPKALEQKVQALRENQRLRDEIDLLRKQLW
ncbi:MAG: hypothetical protein VCD00_01645 [Candidatus Hydrogenedentota bacterium]